MILLNSEKFSIGMVHLLPLIGAPKYRSMDEVLDQALTDAERICKAGFKGILVENIGDMPYYPEKVPPETIASMTAIIQQIKTEVLVDYSEEKKLGVNVLRNDAKAALAIAKAVGADFIRINILHGASVTDQGIIESKAHEILRYRKQLGSPIIKLLVDARVKHAKPMASFELEAEIKDIATRSLADGIIISGEATGKAPEVERVKETKKVTDLPVMIGSGLTKENMEKYLPIIDGYIVGSSLKIGGKLEKKVEEKLAKEFIQKEKEWQAKTK